MPLTDTNHAGFPHNNKWYTIAFVSVIVNEVFYQVVIIAVTLRVVCRNFMCNIMKKNIQNVFCLICANM